MKTTAADHKRVEWSEEDGVYLGKCPDLISGIHGDDPVTLYAELTQLVAEVIDHFEETGHPLPPPTVRPMREVG
jgi:predicted RNase H-like HicB family nuclease